MTVEGAEVEQQEPISQVTFLDVIAVVGIGIAIGVLATVIIYALVGMVAGPLDDRARVVLGSVGSAAIYAGVVASTYLLIVLRRNMSWAAIGLRTPDEPFVGKTLLVWIAAVVAMGIVTILTTNLFGEPPDVRGQLGLQGEDLSGWVIFSIGITAVLAAAVAEEIVFRGLLFSVFRARFSLWPSAFATAILFAATHRILLVMPTLVVLGVALAWLRERFDSVYPPMLLHALNNGLAILALLLSM